MVHTNREKYGNNVQSYVEINSNCTSQVSPENTPNCAGSKQQINGFYDTILKYSLTDYSQKEEKAKDVLSAICEKVTDKNFFSNYRCHIEVMTLQTFQGNSVVIAENKAIVLIMADANHLREYVPTVVLEKKAREELTKLRPDIQILMNIVITPEDYVRVEIFVNYIRKVFVAELSKQMSLGELIKNNTLEVSENPNDYDFAYSMLNPHTVPLRHDLCLTIYLTSKDGKRITDYLIDDESEKNYGSDSPSTCMPLATIAGYTEFIKDREYESKYLPVVHISEISSAILDKALIPFFLKLAMKKFINDGMWLDNCSWMRSQIRGQVDFGALFPDDNGNPLVIDRPGIFDKAVASSFDNVQLVIDVTDGRATIPGLVMNFSSVTDDDTLKAQTNFTWLQQSGVICQFYRGYCHQYGKLCDTANIDFLNEYDNAPYKTYEDYKCLLIRKTPEARAKDERKFVSDFRLYYRSDVVGLTPDLLTQFDDSTMSQNGLNMADMDGIFSNSGV